jgi:hypothetical protein
MKAIARPVSVTVLSLNGLEVAHRMRVSADQTEISS